MALAINTIKAAKGVSKKRKRIGRGNASGHGTYSGKGLKGQKSRSGVSGLKRLGMKQVLLRTPKQRGFKSLKPKNKVVNLSVINIHFKEHDIITPKSLFTKKLVDSPKDVIKVLGNGELTIKSLQFKDLKVSASAAEKIKKVGGKIGAYKK